MPVCSAWLRSFRGLLWEWVDSWRFQTTLLVVDLEVVMESSIRSSRGGGVGGESGGD